VKLETVDAFPVRVKAVERLQAGTFAYPDFQTVVVRAMVDGVEGWGEAMTRFDPGITSLLVKYFAGGITGTEFQDVSKVWETTWRQLRVRGHTRGVDVEALSGIEIALCDCWGKLEKKPVGMLLAKEPKNDVVVFAGSFFDSRGPILPQIAEAKGAGLRGAKVKIGFGLSEDKRILGEVRRNWPDGMLVADANGAYDGDTARRACEEFRDFELAWFEEPVLSDDFAGYRKLTGSGVRIGAGESWFAGDFAGPLAERLVDVLEPSVSRCGGIGTEADVAKKAASLGLGFSPMTGMNSVISVAASLQVASAFPNLGVEYNPFPNPLQSELGGDLPEPRSGRIRVPSKPGLGITVDARFVRSHAA
jgi:L-alanine-DL-glutamate epimerase-like enolase superfamily enzyme